MGIRWNFIGGQTRRGSDAEAQGIMGVRSPPILGTGANALGR